MKTRFRRSSGILYIKTILLFCLVTLFPNGAFAQDLIINKAGEKIEGKIYDNDSTTLNITLNKNGNAIDSVIPKTDVQSLQYNYNSPENTNKDTIAANLAKFQTCYTIGILQGGGSLLGFDIEKMMFNRFGMQGGFGYVGLGGGLNIHFKPTTKSSFVSFQFWHQGTYETYVQSIISANYVYRGKKGLTFQIGFGTIVEKGPAYISSPNETSFLATYAIGYYLADL